VQIANASSASAKSEQGQTESGVWVGSEDGQSIFDAVRSLVKISSRRVMWAHNNVVIIGESLAKESILPVADFFTHNPELRMKTPVVVSKGDAKQYITAKAGMETPSGLSFTYFNDYGTLLGETVKSNMLTLSLSLASIFEQPLIAGVSLKPTEAPSEGGDKSSEGSESKKGSSEGSDKSSGGSESKTIDVSGAAVFDRDKLVGWLSPEETRGAAWILNQTKNTVVTVVDPIHNNQSVALETHGVKSKIIAKVVKGIPHITIAISGTAKIVEEDGPTNQELGKIKKHLETLLNRKIAGNIRSCMTKIQQEYQSDVLGFAAFVHIQNNREWESRLKYKWKETFPQIPYIVRVNMRINSNSLKQQPTKIE
jgi:spore germination protein KC